jgi:peptidoglycan/LPS O-acetylase OafA/YrhL
MTTNRDDNRFDFLRLLAAWLVLFSHCYPLGGQPGPDPLLSTVGIDTLGGIGISIFFVLSGYLIALSIERSRGLLDFARRRALRIYPGLAAICLLCILVLGPAMTSLPLTDYWRNRMTWHYLLNVSAWSIEYPLPGVFAGNPVDNAVNGSLWSLPYEVNCYIALALASLLPVAMRAKVAVALAVLAVVLLLHPPVPPTDPFQKIRGLDYFQAKLGLVFALGAVFALWRDRIQPALWLAAGALVAAVFVSHTQVRLVLFQLGLGVAVLWLALYGRFLPKIPARMGDWSYGAYLYGYPVQQVLAHFKLHEASFAGYVLACSIVTFALAGLSWHLVEKPALRWKERAAKAQARPLLAAFIEDRAGDAHPPTAEAYVGPTTGERSE